VVDEIVIVSCSFSSVAADHLIRDDRGLLEARWLLVVRVLRAMRLNLSSHSVLRGLRVEPYARLVVFLTCCSLAAYVRLHH